jgi:hypothetical protein
MIVDKRLISANGPLVVRDADGDEINHVVHADTKTGLVVQLRTNREGLFVLDPDTHKVDKVERMYPAPLSVRTLFGKRMLT